MKTIEEGKLAYREGKGISDNPYVGSGPGPFPDADAWMAGYELQKAQAQVLEIEQAHSDQA